MDKSNNNKQQEELIDPKEFYELLLKYGIDYFTGVPDSLLKDICGFIQDFHPQEKHIISANEGTAVAMAAGYHLGSGKIPMVYMQNSGLGNSINPILSLCHPKVYSIPMVILIGWRGQPQEKDEPQHMVQGECMLKLIEDMGLKYRVLEKYGIKFAENVVQEAVQYVGQNKCPYFIVVKKQSFKSYKFQQNKVQQQFEMSREQAILKISQVVNGKNNLIVTTTGFASRELYEIRENNKQSHESDFMTVGSMGHASSIALGIAQGQKQKMVWCLDGDGAALMHMGAMAQIGCQKQVGNLVHIVLNNQVYDSVGGQPTGAEKIEFCGIARGCGYQQVFCVSKEEELEKILKEIIQQMQQQENNGNKGCVFLEVMIRSGARSDLGRPKTLPVQNKEQFMQFTQQE